MKKIILLAWMTFNVVWSASGMNLAKGFNDNTNNNGVGSVFECTLNNATYTVFGPNTSSNTGPKNLIGARHTVWQGDVYYAVNPGDIVTFRGTNYTVESVTIHPDPSWDQAIVTIAEHFPLDSGVEFANTNDIVAGAGITVHGMGTSNGEEVWSTRVITVSPMQPILDIWRRAPWTIVYCHWSYTNKTQFIVQKTTNLINPVWTDASPGRTFTFPQEGNSNRIPLPADPSPMVSYRTKSLTPPGVTTNMVLNGWKRGNWDGQRRWGTNVIDSWMDEWFFSSTFDRGAGGDECSATGGDSSGGCFIKDTDGKAKLAGVNVECYQGPFTQDGGQTWFYGSFLDMGGLQTGAYNPETGQNDLDPPWRWPSTDQVWPSRTWYQRIDREWVEGVLQSQQQ